ncbi:MAG: hypothetical protein J0I24_10095 [Thiomonas arsenitoxydans]|uniref:Uncharacterized protein n=1 Tax=Thiomonas arsenitoxydans (strain DSM 22701 / CIP 110005 / 3As) TaxID=426114 RepID=A0A8I1MVQ5_THIA3|nr:MULTISPECIES: hypothetical protein [Thiomonas]MBN8744645.1 hypothetical protein [Thiomonas arsenitoxydans]ODU91474.1 MAG: hypothetical protein ABT24_14665 [Thiomonas sp. SCN 64-16]
MTQDEDKPDTPDDAGAFDRDAARSQLLQTETALREVVRRKRQAAQARARAERSIDPREFALNSLLAIEDELFTLFDSGETLAEMLAYLKENMPGVPLADLRRALKTIRQRRVRSGTNTPASTPGDTGNAQIGREKAVQAHKAAVATPAAATAPPAAHGLEGLELPDWADGSDRMPDESEADYILRKNIEGPPEARRKFIGEHNA